LSFIRAFNVFGQLPPCSGGWGNDFLRALNNHGAYKQAELGISPYRLEPDRNQMSYHGYWTYVASVVLDVFMRFSMFFLILISDDLNVGTKPANHLVSGE